jgi:hypothetical protein
MKTEIGMSEGIKWNPEIQTAVTSLQLITELGAVGDGDRILKLGEGGKCQVEDRID